MDKKKIYLIRGNDTDMTVRLGLKEQETTTPYDLTGAEHVRLSIVGQGKHHFAENVEIGTGADSNSLTGKLLGRPLLLGLYDLEVAFTLDGYDKRFLSKGLVEVVDAIEDDADGEAEGEGAGIVVTLTIQPELIEISGPAGPQGKSAYQVWLDDGHTGTEDDFFEWLAAQTPNPDWNQNDSTKADFIKNRTHWEEESSTTINDAKLAWSGSTPETLDFWLYGTDVHIPRTSVGWRLTWEGGELFIDDMGTGYELGVYNGEEWSINLFAPSYDQQPYPLNVDVVITSGTTVHKLDNKYLDLDSTPALNSQKPVTSDGVKTFVEGKGYYTKPQSGIPASDIAAGVIPTVPTDTVKYSSQSLTDAQKGQARTNIGAASDSEVSQLRSEVNVLATYGRSVLGTVKGYYDKYDGTLKSTTQNYYYADIPIPTGAQTLFVKSNFNSYGNEAVCLFGSSFIIGLFPTKAGIYVQLDGTATTVKVSLVPSDNIEITFFKNRIYTESDIIGVAAKSRVADVVPFIDGYVFVNNGSVGDTIPGGTTGSNVYSYATAEVKRGDVIEITAIVTGGFSYNTYALVDKDNKIVSCPVFKANVYNEIVTVPTDGMISVNTKTANLAISSLKIYRAESLPMAGRKVAIFGDSIVTLRDADGLGIAEYLTRFLGCDIVRCSIGGLFLSCRVQTPVAIANITDLAQCWPYLDLGRSIPKIATGDMTDINTVYQKMQDDFGYTPSADMATAIYNWNNIDFDEIDAVIISAGTNDQRYAPEGTATDDVPYTLNGAINIIVKSLLENYPHLSVYVFSPIVKFVENDLDQWSDDYVADGPGMNGKTLAQVAEIILGAAKRNHIPNCDMYYGMGWTRYNFLNYCNTAISDYTHPYNGFKQMAEKMSGFIVANRTFN